MKLIKLTRATNNELIYVNHRMISCLYSNSDTDKRTKIEFTNGSIHLVKEDLRTILSTIKN